MIVGYFKHLWYLLRSWPCWVTWKLSWLGPIQNLGERDVRHKQRNHGKHLTTAGQWPERQDSSPSPCWKSSCGNGQQWGVVLLSGTWVWCDTGPSCVLNILGWAITCHCCNSAQGKGWSQVGNTMFFLPLFALIKENLFLDFFISLIQQAFWLPHYSWLPWAFHCLFKLGLLKFSGLTFTCVWKVQIYTYICNPLSVYLNLLSGKLRI